MKEVSVIVPTYNERENIAELIRQLDNYLKDYDYEIVVVDDNSPDGTAAVAEELSSRYPVKVLKRPGKMGLTSAIHDGLRISSGKVLVVMDADLQHPPEDVPKLVERTRECDIVVASRYAPGGGIENWSITRRILSRGATLLARVLVPGCSKVRDPVSGFFATRREILEKWKPVEPRGYKALVEILNTARGVRVCEEPYIFRERGRGASKLSTRVMLSYIKLLLVLGLRRAIMLATLVGVLIILVLLIMLR